jgi:hypothetical protein
MNQVQEGIETVNGNAYMRDGQGHLVPMQLVPVVRQVEDQAVRKIFRYADELSGQIARFKGHTADDLGAFDALLTEKYGGKPRGGKKGNRTYMTYDGLMKVTVQIADNITFGPELHTAKDLIDECIEDWSKDANAPIRMLVENAFNTDKEGKINRQAILKLRTVAIEDDRWQRAMLAIGDSIRIVGTRAYYRFYQRPNLESSWEPITVDLAAAEAPARAEQAGGGSDEPLPILEAIKQRGG